MHFSKHVNILNTVFKSSCHSKYVYPSLTEYNKKFDFYVTMQLMSEPKAPELVYLKSKQICILDKKS